MRAIHLKASDGYRPISLQQAEDEHILATLNATSSYNDAACVLSIPQSTLWRKRVKMRERGMLPDRYDTRPPPDPHSKND